MSLEPASDQGLSRGARRGRTRLGPIPADGGCGNLLAQCV